MYCLDMGKNPATPELLPGTLYLLILRTLRAGPLHGYAIAQLIQQLSDRTGLAKNDAAKAVDGVFDLIQDALKSGDEVRLTGFGVFVVATRAGGKGRNPQTGEEITIKPSKQPRFRPGKQLKDALN